MTYLSILGLINDTEHGKHDSDQETQLHTDECRGRHGDQPDYGINLAGAPLFRDVKELPESSPQADNDDAGEDALLEGVEVRSKEQEDEEDDQSTDQAGYL